MKMKSLSLSLSHTHTHTVCMYYPGGPDGKESDCKTGDLGSIPGSEKSPGEGHGNWLQYSFLPGESHGQRSLAGYSPWGHKTIGHYWATNTFNFYHITPNAVDTPIYTPYPSPTHSGLIGGLTCPAVLESYSWKITKSLYVAYLIK